MISKISRILAVLNNFYPDPPIPLNFKTDYQLLCAVVLSAQTTDGKVNEVTKVLFNVAPTAFEMALLEPQTVQTIIQPVGLAPAKAKYLVGLSKIIVDEFNGSIPNTFEGLERLPGVGHKTASVIMSQVFGHPSLAVDTHVHRLAERWGLSKEKDVNKVQRDLCNLFPQETWNKVHLQMIYFGREYCAAKGHSNSECPMCSWIVSHTNPTMRLFTPQKKAKGIVYYGDRIKELDSNPDLISPSEAFSKVIATETVQAATVELEQLPVTRKRRASDKRQNVPVITGNDTKRKRRASKHSSY